MALWTLRYRQAVTILPGGGVKRLSYCLLVLSLFIVGITCYSLWFEACQSCTENTTGMPSFYARYLNLLGLLAGCLQLVLSALSLKNGKNFSGAQALVLLFLLAGGTLIFVGIAAGIYQACPLCKWFWAIIALSILAGIASGETSFRLFLPFIAVACVAIGVIKFDAAAAMSVSNVLPQTPISKVCDPGSLSPDQIKTMAGGKSERTSHLIVTRCSPCALAALIRLAERNPGWQIIVPDKKLDSALKSRSTLHSPEICESAGKATKANLILLTVEQGKILGCNPNVEAMK